jgi:hypothetical protein
MAICSNNTSAIAREIIVCLYHPGVIEITLAADYESKRRYKPETERRGKIIVWIR